MGMMETFVTDEDPILQRAHYLELLQRNCNCINSNVRSSSRSSSDTNSLENLTFHICQMFCETFGVTMNTKIHLMWFHVCDHIRHCGCCSIGNTCTMKRFIISVRRDTSPLISGLISLHQRAWHSANV